MKTGKKCSFRSKMPIVVAATLFLSGCMTTLNVAPEASSPFSPAALNQCEGVGVILTIVQDIGTSGTPKIVSQKVSATITDGVLEFEIDDQKGPEFNYKGKFTLGIQVDYGGATHPRCPLPNGEIYTADGVSLESIKMIDFYAFQISASEFSIME